MHILKGTDLGKLFLQGKVSVLEEEEYVDLIIDCLEHLSQKITVHRLTGDGPGDLLLAPMWSTRKRTVLNKIHSELKSRDAWQGKHWREL